MAPLPQGNDHVYQHLKKIRTVEFGRILARPGSRLPGLIRSISVLNRFVSWEGMVSKWRPMHTTVLQVHRYEDSVPGHGPPGHALDDMRNGRQRA